MSILFTLDDCNKVEEITMAWPSNGYTLKAGTPVSASGIANDGNAIGVLAEDAKIADAYFYGADASAAADYKFRVLTAGYVNIKAAEASFGDEYTDACKAALATAGIVLCDEDDASSFGGGGGAAGVVANAVIGIGFSEDDEIEYEVISVDKTPAELAAAYASGANVVFNISFSVDGEITTSGWAVGATLAMTANGTQRVFASLTTLLFAIDLGAEGETYMIGEEAAGALGWNVVSI